MTARAKTSALTTISLIAASLLALAPRPAAAGDPELRFETIETEHFRIHYHQGLEEVARVAATICEEVHIELTINFGWEVDGPTHVVITDSTDSANGSAQVMYRPLIRLYATAPTVTSSLAQHDHWLRTLIVHEYTHIVHLQIHSGVSRLVNAIFGDIYLPNQISPRWYSEGIAVLNETHRTSEGRIRSAYFTMILRTSALEGTLLDLGALSNGSRQTPRGSSAYIYGGMFMNFLKSRYGEEKIAAIAHDYGGALLPYGLNRSFKRVLGTDLITLYDEFIAELEADADATRERLAARGLTTSTRLTKDGETKGTPIFSPDSKSLLVSQRNGRMRSGIYRMPLDGGPLEEVVISSMAPISLDRGGRLFYTRTAPFDTYYRFYDVFALDRPGSEPRRVTSGVRAWHAAISPRGDLLVMTVNDAGTSRLVLADERGNPLRTLIDSAPFDQVFHPSWSPDGATIALAVKRGPAVDLALVDVKSGDLELLTADRALETNPTFDPTGRYLVYSSDRTGIANIYAMDLEERRLHQLTNVLTGAFSPAVSHDGRTLAFVKYSSIGDDLHIMPFDPTAALEPEPVGITWEAPPPTGEPSTLESRRYNPLPSFLPRHWQLETSLNTDWDAKLSAVTALSDAVGRHRVGAQIDYVVEENVIAGRAAYAYGGFGPGLHLGFSHTLDPRDTGYTVGGESQHWIQEVTRGSLKLSVPIPAVDRGHSLSFGYAVTHAQPREEPDPPLDPRGSRPDVPTQYFRTGIELGWSFSDTLTDPMGISAHQGRRLSAHVSFYHPAFGGDQTLATIKYSWTEFLSMPWLEHHVLALRLGGGVHVSNPPKQASFSVGGYGEQNIVDVIWNNTQAGLPQLRGYPQGAFQGDQYHTLKVEYRLPIWFTEAAYGTVPFFLKRIQAGVFTDNAVITYDPVDVDDWRSSLGAEIVWQLIVGFYQPMSLRTGYAYGFMDGGTHEIIIVLGGSF